MQVPVYQRKALRSTELRNLVRVSAAAEADIDTTAEPVGDGEINVKDFKTGIAHVYDIRGSPSKVGTTQPGHQSCAWLESPGI